MQVQLKSVDEVPSMEEAFCLVRASVRNQALPMGRLLGSYVLASQKGITMLLYRRTIDAVYSQAPADFIAAAVLPH